MGTTDNMSKITRRQFISTGVTLGTLFFGVFGEVSSVDAAVEPLSYDLLCMRLYAKTDAEKAYLKDIVDKMDDKVIPQKFVYAAFRYAMKKDKLKRIIYFDRCLVYLCGRARIQVKFKPLAYTKNKF